MQSKQDLRRQYLEQRDQLNEASLLAASRRLCQHLWQWYQAQNLSKIAAFQSFRNEPFLETFLAKFPPEQVFFPVVQAGRGLMDFFHLAAEEPTQVNRYGIREPLAVPSHRLQADAKTLILVPALAFDRKGYRLGYGAGYYDRYLAGFTGVSVGICLEDFLTETLPTSSFDLPVQHLVTDAAFYPHMGKNTP